jgi:peptide/nickel transport system ATP-binding protein
MSPVAAIAPARSAATPLVLKTNSPVYESIIARQSDTAPLQREDLQLISTPQKTLLSVKDLRIELDNGEDIVSDISFQLAEGKILGLVGESGSGKSTIASALLGHTRTGAIITQGQINIGDTDVLTLNAKQLRDLRGNVVSHVSQDPATSLNPLMRIGKHLDELLQVHQPKLSKAGREERILAVFTDVGLPAEREFLKRFPHQLSGGQQQRVQLALAFVLRPRLIVLDEPTTALDVTTQSRVLKTIRHLCQTYKVSAIYVSHDLAVVQELVDQIIVLYAGRVVESAPLKTLFAKPSHPYTQGLLAAVPDVAQRRFLQPIPGQAPSPGTRPHGCSFAERCPLRSETCQITPVLSRTSSSHETACWHQDNGPAFISREDNRTARKQNRNDAALLRVENLSAFYGKKQVVFDASFSLKAGECVALVGESGSGKTTIARALAGVGDDSGGNIYYGDKLLPFKARDREPQLRHQVQYIFQNPYRALNPRHTVGTILINALQHFFKLSHKQAWQRAVNALNKVSLQSELMHAYPRELSGGERQRVAIARALVCEPRLLICDEITSALDVSVQANILALLRELQAGGLSLLFVTHDLGVVRAIADDVVVLHQGVIVEQGPVDEVLDTPEADYTRLLVFHSPSSIKQLQSTWSQPFEYV